MNGEKCIKCKKPMGNSLHNVTALGHGTTKFPVHMHCFNEDRPISTTDFVDKYSVKVN